MNTFQLSNTKELLEPEELEYWETNDFDDFLPHFEASEQENELVWNDISGWDGWDAGSFH